MSDERKPLHLFEAFGVELEYMIVREKDLKVDPITDKVIFEEVGQYVSDVELENIAWSNELVLHVIELKTNGPAKKLEGLPATFQNHISKINKILEKHNAKLLPTGAHPFMDPYTETCLWPHEHNAIYEAYDRIFSCKGHGWSNLQSTHLNLPFANDEEFGKLHAAIRLLLPIIPALSASSPVMDGKPTGFIDSRLEVYRKNQEKIPSIAGKVIPERVFTQQEYQEQIFDKMYEDIGPYDPEQILQNEFLNSRGAIARFDRNTIEIRIIDIQECPLADIAVLHAVVQTLETIMAERWTQLKDQKQWHESDLAAIFLKVVEKGQSALIDNLDYLRCFGCEKTEPVSVKELWQHILQEVFSREDREEEFAYALNVILTKGNLSERILHALHDDFSEGRIKSVYHALAECLKNGTLFLAD
ncbi:MAG: glutamate-cysteine ligase family protein [Hymenobacteraceae bacterium]|nr:glutamate-cysteine ligase family protein [Hymenobacteraceae bacterium]